MSANKIQATSQEIEAQLQNTIREMQEHQKNGNYVEAEKSRLRMEQLKKDYESRKLYELEMKHRNQLHQIGRTHNEELDSFNKFWDKKLEEYYAEGQRLEKDMSDRHQGQLKTTRQELEAQLSIKLKQSSELLNLRRMEEHMAKQKNYVQAQKVKQRCIQLQKQQKQAWMNARALKIQAGINKLKNKHEGELGALQKKIKTGMDEQLKDRGIEQGRLNQKFANISKQLRMQQDKQVLAHKGQFKSKGGSTGSPNMSKSKTGFGK